MRSINIQQFRKNHELIRSGFSKIITASFSPAPNVSLSMPHATTDTNLISLRATHLRIADGLPVFELLQGGLVLPEVDLGAHQHDGRGRAVVTHFLVPLRWARRNDGRLVKSLAPEGKLESLLINTSPGEGLRITRPGKGGIFCPLLSRLPETLETRNFG